MGGTTGCCEAWCGIENGQECRKVGGALSILCSSVVLRMIEAVSARQAIQGADGGCSSVARSQQGEESECKRFDIGYCPRTSRTGVGGGRADRRAGSGSAESGDDFHPRRQLFALSSTLFDPAIFRTAIQRRTTSTHPLRLSLSSIPRIKVPRQSLFSRSRPERSGDSCETEGEFE